MKKQGWKTYLAGALSIAFGIGQLVVTGGASINESVGFILAGLGTIGVGHKIEKAKDAWGPKAPVG